MAWRANTTAASGQQTPCTVGLGELSHRVFSELLSPSEHQRSVSNAAWVEFA